MFFLPTPKSREIYEIEAHRKRETIRREIATAAMQGYCSCSETNNVKFEDIAKWSVECADALSAELEQ